ncbi:MAG TPA: metalloregulator ArsR/SmtB family transcription factor [Vicinamibacterales bacterium]|jgi:ArsR family transcriptional regulator
MKSKADAQFEHMNTALRGLADPTRLRILALLIGGEVCVCHIHEALNIPQPTASRHLAYLRKSGLVDARREGLWVYYSLAKMRDAALGTIVETVTHCVGHADTIGRDRKRLERATGCCVAESAHQPRLSCCGSV